MCPDSMPVSSLSRKGLYQLPERFDPVYAAPSIFEFTHIVLYPEVLQLFRFTSPS